MFYLESCDEGWLVFNCLILLPRIISPFGIRWRCKASVPQVPWSAFSYSQATSCQPSMIEQ
jgi:hypothetical protein